MNLRNATELANTRAKLKLLEDQYESARSRPVVDESARELTLRSLKRLINQLKEEIVRYESHAASGVRNGDH